MVVLVLVPNEHMTRVKTSDKARPRITLLSQRLGLEWEKVSGPNFTMIRFKGDFTFNLKMVFSKQFFLRREHAGAYRIGKLIRNNT